MSENEVVAYKILVKSEVKRIFENLKGIRSEGKVIEDTSKIKIHFDENDFNEFFYEYVSLIGTKVKFKALASIYFHLYEIKTSMKYGKKIDIKTSTIFLVLYTHEKITLERSKD